MSPEHFSQWIDRTLFSGLQPGVTHILKTARIYSGVLAGGMKSIFPACARNAARCIKLLAPLSEAWAPEHSLNLELPHFVYQQHTGVDQEPRTMQETILRNQKPFTLDASQPAVIGGHDSYAAPAGRPKRSWMWKTALIVGPMCLIVVPGLILGFVTGQIAWGIAISGAVAPAVVFFGGLYNHHNK